ncbi:hypothetical protein [Methylomicrobium sp. Wu6]|uniref:hypothetical protein n=1 Tax=Methylomicrobium sp. Wu6 TaxID=3107928 RepID=UPI002DD68625|nr:hypothetical protein [Methylomicrobium sp. Wu6]MEC4749519.1 hypothetical protein [Methylomicrobium sp. Wu6]
MATVDIIRQYLPLCWFRHNPLELTRSASFFKQNLIFYYLIEYFLQANMTDDPFESFYEVTIETGLTLLFIGLMMFFNKTLYGFVQVTTAMMLCANVVALFIIPVMIWLTVSDDPFSYYILFALIFWDFTLVAYIFKKVIEINIFASVILALLYFITTYLGAFGLGQLI